MGKLLLNINGVKMLKPKMESKYAPVVIFGFNRPAHIKKTLESLSDNLIARYTDLIVYIDGPRTKEDLNLVEEVFNIARNLNGFNSVEIIKRPTNYGLALNIVEGVGEVVNLYGRVIVLEDDILVNNMFLCFMNESLERYSNNPNVWHIAGWNYPISPEGLDDAFFWRAMKCWGWATWKDRWEFFEKNPQKLINNWNEDKIKRFNLDGIYNYWDQVVLNNDGKINTWAIFWYATIFENDGLCLSPTKSFVQNIGFDGTGENCDSSNMFVTNLSNSSVSLWPEKISESMQALNRIQNFYLNNRQSILQRLFNKLKKVANMIEIRFF